MTTPPPLAGHTAVVSGGSRGIGRAIALALAAAGADVAVSFRAHEDAAREVTRAIEGSGRRGLAVRADARNPQEADEFVATVDREWGRIDIVVANAGISGESSWHQFSAEEWTRVLATDLFGPLALVRAARSQLRSARGNAVIIGSIAGLVASPEGLPYSVAKAGVLHLARNLALALAPEVRVNAVAPGWVHTDMTETLWADPRGRASTLRSIPLGRWGEPEDVARAVVFLAGDCARFVTGATLVLDGGESLYWRAGAGP